MRTVLYGKKAANLYTQAFVQNTQARALYQESEDTYYRANDAASYDDWRRARHQWDYFYNRFPSLALTQYIPKQISLAIAILGTPAWLLGTDLLRFDRH
eukprot:CAMPEP_0184327016 /NCGR_PEP_ID=MMETSP1049-20130417/142871_1 /TAXON_ID=77928 /ORGANISM="Proteomonas sulcata, Strain CCMP704" /LENGTH=98 /DNA_ID=CAMNT_0026649247 /DNA_START=829 /DNA_END=1125 /DNA_ORIENTATION=-